MSISTVPFVSEQDLLDFHRKHFQSAQPPAQFFTSQGAEDFAEEDDLKHYPDGVKRYLTDEQIQIFRHSELHRLLLARQVSGSASVKSATAGSPAPESKPSSPAPSYRPLSKNQKRRENLKKKKKQQAKQLHDGPARCNSALQQGKHKWNSFIFQDQHLNPNRLTHRRIAREMDEQRYEPTVLSYDD